MEAPMAQMSLEANLSATDAPNAQNEEPSHSFVAPLAQPIAPTTGDESDEWEYEYSTTETETFYLTLDLTTPSIPTSRPLTVSSRNGRAGFRAKWLNPGLGRRKHLLGQAPTLRVNKDKDGEDVEGEGEGLDEDEDAPGETDLDALPDEPEQPDQALQSKADEPKEHKIQILDLESNNPLVSYRDHIFTCQWARNIGTELLFAGRHDTEGLPTLRKLKGGVDLLGACTARITSQTATLVPIAQTKPTDLTEDNDGPLVESVSAAASDERRNQARFLERLMKIKKEKGEKDEVTVVAYKRLRWNGWIELLNKRRNEEREDLKRKLRRAEGEAKEAIEKRLKELDEEEKNMPIDAPPQGDDELPEENGNVERPVKRRRKKRVPKPRNEPLPEGVELRTGERAKPIRRRPRGDWKRYNVDGTIVPPVLEAPKVPGDAGGTVWKGWHEGRIENEDGEEDEAHKSDNDNNDDQDEDGDAMMTDAHPHHGSSVAGGYETQWDGHQASSVVGHDFDRGRGFESSPLKGSSIAGWDYDEHERNAEGSRPGSSHMQSFATGRGIGFRTDSMHTPPVLSRSGSHVGIGFRDDHAASAPVSVHGAGFEDEHAASAPGSVHGAGLGDGSQQHYFQGIGAAHEVAEGGEGQAQGKGQEGEHHLPPPGGWMGLLEGDDIPHLPGE